MNGKHLPAFQVPMQLPYAMACREVLALACEQIPTHFHHPHACNQFYTLNIPMQLPYAPCREVVAHVRAKYPHSTLLAAGWSLGANILVNYLGEAGPSTPLSAAVSLCNPFDLAITNDSFGRGFNQVYSRNLAEAAKAIFAKHEHVFVNLPEVGGQRWWAEVVG